MLERFTQPARQVVHGAQIQRRRLRHDFIGTEHLLLGMLEEDSAGAGALLRAAGVDADQVRAEIERYAGQRPGRLGESDALALRSIGIDLDAVRSTVEETFGEGALEAPPLPGRRRFFGGRYPASRLSNRARKVLELSLREALRLGHRHIGSEHLLLGLLREGEGLAVLILTRTGVDLAELRRSTVRALERAA